MKNHKNALRYLKKKQLAETISIKGDESINKGFEDESNDQDVPELQEFPNKVQKLEVMSVQVNQNSGIIQ